MLRFGFWEMKTKAYSYMKHVYKHTDLAQRGFFHIFPLPKCHLKSDAEANKVRNAGCLSWVKLRKGIQVNNSILQNK